MPQDEIEKIEDEETQVDGKALAIKLTTMALVTAATLVATNLAINAIKNRES